MPPHRVSRSYLPRKQVSFTSKLPLFYLNLLGSFHRLRWGLIERFLVQPHRPHAHLVRIQVKLVWKKTQILSNSEEKLKSPIRKKKRSSHAHLVRTRDFALFRGAHIFVYLYTYTIYIYSIRIYIHKYTLYVLEISLCSVWRRWTSSSFSSTTDCGMRPKQILSDELASSSVKET
jgi:hypothetical protein